MGLSVRHCQGHSLGNTISNLISFPGLIFLRQDWPPTSGNQVVEEGWSLNTQYIDFCLPPLPSQHGAPTSTVNGIAQPLSQNPDFKTLSKE